MVDLAEAWAANGADAEADAEAPMAAGGGIATSATAAQDHKKRARSPIMVKTF
jgi:hypothetical protein